MNEELYIDVVSRTIISRISEEIEQSISEKLNNSLNKLLLTTFPELISNEITPAFDRMRKEMQKSIEESSRKLQEEINEIRQQMERNSKEQNGLLSNVLECDFKELSQQLTSGVEGLQNEIAGQGDVVQKALDATIKTIQSQMEADVTGRFKGLERSITEVCSELKEIRDQIEENRRLFPKDMYNNMKSLGVEFTTGLDGLQKEIASLKDSEPKEAALALENIQKEMAKTAEESGRKLRDEIEEARQHTRKSSGDQNKMLLNVIEGNLKKMHTQFASDMEGLKKDIANLKDKGRIEANIMVRLKTVEETGKLLHEELKGVRHLVEKSIKRNINSLKF